MALQNRNTEPGPRPEFGIDDIDKVLEGRHDASGRNKKVFNLDEIVLKLVHDGFNEDFDWFNDLKHVAETWIPTTHIFEQSGITGEKGNVVLQYASDGNFAYGMEEMGWKTMLAKTVGMQEGIIEETMEESSAFLCYDLKPSNIHVYHNGKTYEPRLIDVADLDAIEEVQNSTQLRSKLAEAYAFMLEGKDTCTEQKGLIQYAEEAGVDIEKAEAVNVVAENSDYVRNDLEYNENEDLPFFFESNMI